MGGGLGCPSAAPQNDTAARALRAQDCDRGSATIAEPARRGHLFEMPNIKQQKKRVRIASQQRLENLRFRSTAKTLARRLREAAAEGDDARVDETHRQLVSWLDRAAARGAIHKNTAARRKAQAAKLREPRG